MFDRFTDRARIAMTCARAEAVRFNHNYIGTEHLLLGIIREGGGVAILVLKQLDVPPESIRTELEKYLERGISAPPHTIPFTPRAKHVLELAIEEARSLSHGYVGTQHLLLGLMRET